MGVFQTFKDRFLSRGGGNIESFVMAAYGKLPIYKDYIIWECYQGGAAEFKQWLDDAFGLTWEDLGDKSARLRGPCRALILLPGKRHAVAAAMWPSADEGNMRKFPFALFACFGRSGIVNRGLRGALEALDPVWQALEAEYDQVRQCGHIEDLYTYLQQSNPQVEPAGEPPGEDELSLAEWFEDIYPDRAPAFRKWIDSELQMAIDAYRSFEEQGESLAVRLPLARSLGTARQVEFWEQVFKQNLKRCPAMPSLVIERTDGEGPDALSLVWRELKREDSRLFADKIHNYEFIETLMPDKLVRPGPEEKIDPDLTIDQWIAGFAEQ